MKTDPITWESLQHRALADHFAARMAAALDSHKHLGKWTQWHPDRDEMVLRLHQNSVQLYESLVQGGPSDIIRHAINLSNICMKIVEVYESAPKS